ncbi:hypothetical protein [Cyanobium sp. Morenito 9A2]|uniref:hypothetical protein n=1 Tax=Cyanobium sp. Morenito 9A2 TaxID=2823718 RepID=UPI0020CF476F|nr:hypothetical protein [Cyanobium sp. Morenito 9A2]MCP9850588.1 hypothetical protein [Cyanobium sp. Morenito 9A2]
MATHNGCIDPQRVMETQGKASGTRAPCAGRTRRSDRYLASLAVALLLASLAPIGSALARDDSGSFGRWQWSVGRCERNLEGLAPSSCGRVQVDQATEGMLTIRFIASGPKRDGNNVLLFVGLLPKGEAPMRCRQGSCEPVGPVRAEVSTVSEHSFDGRGVAEGLPKAWPAEGSCRVALAEVSCEAKALSGERWRAQAHL